MIRNSHTFDRALSLITLMAIVMASFPVFPRVAEAADTIFEDGFENNPAFTSPAWTADPQWGATGSSAHSGSKKAKVEGSDTDADVLETTIDTSGYEDITLSFWYRYEGLEDDDTVLVEWFDGSSWNNVESFVGQAGDADDVLVWTQLSEVLPAGAEDNPSFAIRFTSEMDAGNDQFFLDDVVIDGEEIVDGPAVPECSSEDDVDLTTFDTFSLASVNGQNDWSSTGPYDQEVVENTYGFEEFGCKSLRISNAVTTGAFGDQTFAAPTTGAAGESTVASNNHFEAQFDIASTKPELQSGLALSVSPDDGNGSRMSYLSFTDTADGIDVVFYDVTNTGPLPSTTTWNATEVATLDRDESHTIKFVMDFVDGPANDVVKIYINDVLVHTGTSWEDYYRYDSEQTGNGNVLFPVDTLIFRAGGTAVPANDGNGFLFDNLSLLVSEGEPDTEVLVDVLVTPSDLIEAADVPTMYDDEESWFFYNDETDTIDNTLGSFVDGPDTAPLGDGSVEISVSGTQRRNLATYQFSGTKLADITELKFSTYNPSAGNGGGSDRSAYLNFNVDFTGADTWQKRIAYVPSQNGTVDQNDWQEWDAIDGGDALWWWSGFAANGNKWPDNNTNEYRTWDDLLTSFPNIAVRTTDSWLGLRVGEPYSDGYTENIDKFVIGIDTGTTTTITTYDFDPEQTATVKICKMNEDQDRLDGWTLMLLGDKVETVDVPSNGSEVFSTNNLDGDYAFIANGSYIYRPGYTGSTTDAAYSMRTDGNDPIDPTGHPFDPWVRVNDFGSPYEGYLGITVDGALGTTDWGSIFNPLHEYALQYSGEGDPASFKIVDSAYGDNSGTLTVDIYEGYADVTGEDGCVTFDDVPLGDYVIDEIMQEGWSNLSGLGEVVVDGEEEVFTVVNQTPLPPQMCSVTVVSDETNYVEQTEENAVLAWTHQNWTAVIELAEWIWGSDVEETPGGPSTETFVKTFEWSGGVASATLDIAADNQYTVYLNGVEVASSSEENNFQIGTQENDLDVSSEIITGINELVIEVVNLNGEPSTSNPAGLMYNLTVVSDETGEDCMFAPEADLEITRPETEDQVLSGEYTFEAEYIDADDNADPVQWAIRAGTCNSGSRTVAGNVDQFSGASSTPYMWNGASFSSTIDMDGWEEGEYCFVVNPTEDGGTNFRETRWFTLEHPEPTQCLIVSDTSTLVVENNDFAVETWDEHNNWTHDIADATWIWDSFYVEDPEATTTRTFKETFTVTEVGAAELDIAADNTYTVYINGDLVAEHLNANNYQTPDEYDVTSFIDEGENELEIIVTNNPLDNSIPKTNPAGLLFRLEIETDGGQCLSTTEPDDGEPEPTPTYEVFGFAWNDDNANDVKDGEEGYLAGVAVEITNGSTTVATTTDAGGRYYFMVASDTWTLSAALSGWYLTYPNTATSTHEAVVVATTSGPYDFGLDANEAIVEDDGGSDRVNNDDDDNNDDDGTDTGPDGQVAGTSTTFGVGGGIDLWEDLRNEIGNSGGPFGSVLGATAEAQELDATTTIEVGDDEATPSEDDEENASAPWKNWLCDYLWLLPLLWIIVSALAYWRKESYEDPRAMLWTQIIFGAVAFILLVTYFIWEVPCAWVPSAIVAIGSAVMSYYGKE